MEEAEGAKALEKEDEPRRFPRLDELLCYQPNCNSLADAWMNILIQLLSTK